jgi:hypothetical protein
MGKRHQKYITGPHRRKTLDTCKSETLRVKVKQRPMKREEKK